jgi:hypothetical protein
MSEQSIYPERLVEKEEMVGRRYSGEKKRVEDWIRRRRDRSKVGRQGKGGRVVVGPGIRDSMSKYGSVAVSE